MPVIKYSNAQVENLITLLAHDPKHGKLVAQLIEPQLFEAPLRDIAERLVVYWKKYKTCPGPHTADLFSDIIEKKNSEKADEYKLVLRQMSRLQLGINTEYVLNMLKETSRRQHMKSTLLKAAEIAQQETIDLEEGEVLLAAFVRGRQFTFDRGLRLDEIDRIVDYLDKHYSEFTTGIDLLDQANVVPARGQVLLFVAPTRRGKTWFLTTCGKHAVLQRKRVLHLSLEQSEEEVGQRYYQTLFAIPKHFEDIELANFDIDEGGRFKASGGFDLIVPKISFDSKHIRKVLKQRMAWLIKRRMHERLIIKRFPPRSLTMDMLRGYLDMLSADGFDPDLIALDYIGICKTDAANHRISLGRVFEEFRAVCIERNMAGVTAQQASKAGEKAYQVDLTHGAEDWSMMGTADNVLTFTQTDAEKARGLARLLVGKARGENDGWGIVLSQNYATGQFALRAARLGKAYNDMIEQLTADTRAKDDDED